MRATIVLLLALAAVTSAGAQGFPREVAPGVRVRVAISDTVRQPEGTRQQLLRGTVASVAGDSLRLRLPRTAGVLSLARADVRRLERSLGVSRAESAVRGFFGGAFGAAAFALFLRGTEWALDDRSPGDAALLGAGIGAGVGLVVGAALPSERWRHVRLR
ncbi:MAG TPA: hypothetical protein VEA99_17925 [Gemmatimonadaceae bacterium]|nr:hypothetical protein [Gemmatimonadaceae bacterium]